jgi:hypothetical protein
MSLSSILLASAPKKIDKELDALFKSNVGSIPLSVVLVIHYSMI